MVCEAVLLFQRQRAVFNAEVSRRNALRFARWVFKERMQAFLTETMGRSIA
jgi:hypothetical protein